MKPAYVDYVCPFHMYLHNLGSYLSYMYNHYLKDSLFSFSWQEAEKALNAKIAEPLFHRVRDVAPNKV